jgi:hypothetical protein
MRGVYPWLYADYKENLWKFSLNENKELNYGIMYREGKWTKENIIDSRVTAFGLFIDDNEGIHLVYSNTKGELRYCTMKDKQWVGKILYKVEDTNYDIESIKIEIIGPSMHIFYALASKDGSDHGVLMHCIWDGHKTDINNIQDIILKPELKEYYLININIKGEIYLFYLSDEGDEISLNYSIYQNNSWLESNRLYGIQGEEIHFEAEVDKNNIHILNKYREDSMYLLDHVIVDLLGGLKDFRVYEGKKNIREPLIFNDGNKIYSCWIDNNEIYYSIFTGASWSKPIKYNVENSDRIERYNGYISEGRSGYIKERKLYGTTGLDLYLYFPKDFLVGNDIQSSNINRNNINNDIYNEELELIRAELYRAKEENKVLEDKIAHLNLLFQKNQQGIEKYQQQVIRAMDQKRKAEENSNIFLELQKKIQGEYEILSENLAAVEKEKMDIKQSLDGYINEIKLLKEEINNLRDIVAMREEKLQEELNLRKVLEEQNITISEENELIKKELSLLLEENKKISTELEIERNQSVMDRLLRRRN